MMSPSCVVSFIHLKTCKSMEYKILDYNEGLFELNSEFEFSKDSETEISLMIAPVLLYRDDSDIVGLQFTVFYRSDETEILKFGYVATIAVNGWGDIVSGGMASDVVATELKEAWDEVLQHGRDVLNAKIQNTPLKDLSIPDVPMDSLKKIVRIVKM